MAKYIGQSETAGISDSMLLIAMEFSDWTIVPNITLGKSKLLSILHGSETVSKAVLWESHTYSYACVHAI